MQRLRAILQVVRISLGLFYRLYLCLWRVEGVEADKRQNTSVIVNPRLPERQPVVLTSAANTFWSRVRVHETDSLLKVHKMPSGEEFRKLLKRA